MSDNGQFSTRNWDIFKAIVAVILFALMIGLSLRVLPFTQPAPAAVLPAGAAAPTGIAGGGRGDEWIGGRRVGVADPRRTRPDGPMIGAGCVRRGATTRLTNQLSAFATAVG
jgi:hypothetical protein